MYLDQNEDVYLIPTAEVPVTNFYRTRSSDNFQLKDVRTLCFQETGSWGKM